MYPVKMTGQLHFSSVKKNPVLTGHKYTWLTYNVFVDQHVWFGNTFLSIFFFVFAVVYVFSRSGKKVTGQQAFLTGHCLLNVRYFEP